MRFSDISPLHPIFYLILEERYTEFTTFGLEVLLKEAEKEERYEDAAIIFKELTKRKHELNRRKGESEGT